jgi:hypothetical protein
MMQKLPKFTTLLLIFILCSISITCSKDEDIISMEPHSHNKVNKIDFSDFTERISDKEFISSLNKRAESFEYDNKSSNVNPLQNAQILTNRIIAIEHDSKLFYTFAINAPNSEGSFYNFVLTTTMKGTVVKTELFRYTPTTHWIQDISKPFDGFIKLINKSPFSLEDFWTTKGSLEACVASATGAWECDAGNNHSPEDCKSPDNPEGVCDACGADYFITVTYEPCPDEEVDNTPPGGGGGETPVDNTGGGGGGSSGGDGTSTSPIVPCEDGKAQEVDENGNCYDIEDPDIITEPIDRSLEKECKKITDLLNVVENQTFKNKLIELSSPANLDLNYEKAVSLFENQTALDEREGTADSAFVSILANPVNKYKAIVHTHPSIGAGTSSVFSPADLIEFARLIENNKISTGFVAFLTTKKGTKYALTIDNPTKFLNFFYSQLFDNVADAISSDPLNAMQISNRFYASRDAFIPLYNQYFNPEFASRKIKETNINNEGVLQEFLNFMDAADAGFTLFEALGAPPNGAPFETFRKLTLENGQPIRKECN